MDNVLKTDKPFSWLGGVDENGTIIQKGHELRGQNLAGKELHFPGASGSTVGSYVLIGLAKRGCAPNRIVMERADPITAWGAAFAKIPLSIKGREPKTIDISELENKGIPEDILKYILDIGDCFGFKDFVPVRSAQIAGVSYKTIGEAGSDVIRNFSKRLKVKAPAVLNPAGMDMKEWRKQRIPEDFAEKQKRIIRSYKLMGIEPTCTCTPYYSGTIDIPFNDAFWSESSAVAFANSVLGIRTNRESGLSALLYSLVGYGPRYGLHLDENRNPTVKINVDIDLKDIDDFGALGYAIGEEVKEKIPYITGVKASSVSLDKLKSLGAAGAASGSLALYHVDGITPEARAKTISLGKMEKISLDDKDILEVRGKLNTGDPQDIDLVAFGCPHASQREIKDISEQLSGKKIKPGVDFWVCTSRATKAWCEKFGYVQGIEKAGGHVYCDTCMVVAPIEEMGYRTTATNSGKAAYYLPNFCKQKVVFGNTKSIIDKVTIK